MPHPLRPYPPLIVNAALTGIVPRQSDVPALPVTAEEIVDDALAAVDAGASILHLHARTPDEGHEWRRQAYEAFIPAIRARCPDAVICVTTSGRAVPELDRRADVLRLDGDARPDMASLTLGSLNFRREASVNAPDTIRGLAEAMREAGIKPELEVFDSGMAYLACELLDRGILEPPLYANVILGGPNTAPARAGELAHLVESLPPGTVWAAGGMGSFQLPANGLAVFMGGHVRTGLEDNPWLDHQLRTPATNEALIRRVTELGGLAGRELASPAETRRMLGLTEIREPAAPC